MMSTPNRAILSSAIKENFNGNHMGLQGGKWPWKNQQFKNKDRSLGVERTKLSEQQEESRGNIPSRIDPSKVRIDPCLSVTASPRFSGYRHLGFHAKACKDRFL